jgi:hypothetical protein
MKKKVLKNKVPTKSIKWGCQNLRIISCQTLNIKKNWIEGKNQKEKSNLQKNSKHKKKTKKINFQWTQ